MNFLAPILVAWFVFHYLTVVEAIIVKPASDEIVRQVLAPPKESKKAPTDPRKEAFLETCPKYGFTPKKCEYIWSHEDDQTALTLPTKGVKIEVTETPLIEDKE